MAKVFVVRVVCEIGAQAVNFDAVFRDEEKAQTDFVCAIRAMQSSGAMEIHHMNGRFVVNCRIVRAVQWIEAETPEAACGHGPPCGPGGCAIAPN